ncbi:hypothetical protein ABZ172_13570 [Streptomyces sp. NPDC006296]|uniref:hypothetical protein n=1 Tax=Streptomyces sp. NPDC006296 TaxID=3156746 RepID=UPI0033BA3D0C
MRLLRHPAAERSRDLRIDTARLVQSHGPVFTDFEAQLAAYRMLLERLDAAALPTGQSRDLVHTIAQER